MRDSSWSSFLTNDGDDDDDKSQRERGADRINNVGGITTTCSFEEAGLAVCVLYCDSRDLCIMLLTLYFDCDALGKTRCRAARAKRVCIKYKI